MNTIRKAPDGIGLFSLPRSMTLVAVGIALAQGSAGQVLAGAPSSGCSPISYVHRPVFVENQGQWDGDFLYKARLDAMTVFVRRTGWTFTVANDAGNTDDGSGRDEGSRGVAVNMQFLGSAGCSEIEPGPRAPGVHNYFLGNDPGRWRTWVPLHERLRLVGIRPGVDVACRSAGGRFEYDLLVSPGVDLSQVAIEVNGADGLRLDVDGTLVIETALGPVRQPQPVTWQTLPDGRAEPIECRYALFGKSRFGFVAADWNGELPLVIDPVLLFASYLGGGLNDVIRATAVDPSGGVTVAGYTDSGPSFPSTPGAYDTTPLGTWDAFVSRLSGNLSSLVFSTFIGGPDGEEIHALALDSTGGPVIAGAAYAGFPTTPGCYQSSFSSIGCCNPNAFVARFNPTGSALVFSTYIGSAEYDIAHAVAMDLTGDIIVVGACGAGFPTTAGAYDQTYNNYQDVFVARLSAAGNVLMQSTLLGGSFDDIPRSVAVDASGTVTVCGLTRHSDFPVTAGAYDVTYNDTLQGPDGFVTRFAGDLGSLVYSTFIGGAFDDSVNRIAVDASGAVFLTGQAGSNFPTVPPVGNIGINAFVARLNASGSAVSFATAITGSGDDWGNAIVLDGAGGATIAGRTASSNFQTTVGALDSSLGGALDAFVASVDSSGALTYSSYLGGTADDYVNAMATDAAGVLILAGRSFGTFPVTPNAYDTSYAAGLGDGFIAKMQLGSFTHPLMAFPSTQTTPSGGILGLQVVGPTGAAVGLMFDGTPLNIAVPPYGSLGVSLPPLITLDGIGLGFPVSIPVLLQIGDGGMLYFGYSPVPPSLVGITLYAQAVSVHASFPGGIALSTHGDITLPSAACKVTFVP